MNSATQIAESTSTSTISGPLRHQRIPALFALLLSRGFFYLPHGSTIMAKSTGISHSDQVKAIGHIRKANACHREAEKGLTSFAEYAIQAGAALREAKLTIPHGRWGSFCDQHFDGTLRTAQFYMNLNERLNGLPKAQYIALLSSEQTLAGINRSLKKLEGKSTSKSSSGASARSGGGGNTAHRTSAAQSQDEPDAPTERCPACNLVKWKKTADGYECGKCRHVYGEPAGDTDDVDAPDDDGWTKEQKVLKQKTRKTFEAAMRAISDLHEQRSNRKEHAKILEYLAQSLLAIQRWP